MPRYETEKRIFGGTPSSQLVFNRCLSACAMAGITALLATSMSGCKNPNRPGRYRPPASTSTVTTQSMPTSVQTTSNGNPRRRTAASPTSSATTNNARRVTTTSQTASSTTNNARRRTAASQASSASAVGSQGRIQLVDDTSASELGMQSAWQQRIPFKGSGGLKQVFVAGGGPGRGRIPLPGAPAES